MPDDNVQSAAVMQTNKLTERSAENTGRNAGECVQHEASTDKARNKYKTKQACNTARKRHKQKHEYV